MLHLDLMLNKAEALRRQEEQRTNRAATADSQPARVYRSRQLPPWLRRARHSLAGQLVAWSEWLRDYDTVPAVPGYLSHNTDCFETVK